MSMRYTALFFLLLAIDAAVIETRGQSVPDGTPPDIARMVREGLAEALDARFRGGATADQHRLLALAYANKAQRASLASVRAQAYDKAEENFELWAKAARGAGRLPRAQLRLAGGLVEYGNVLLGGRAAKYLDEWELTAGKRGDQAEILRVLRRAGLQYKDALERVDPLMQDLFANEDQYLAEGIFDDIQQVTLDAKYNLAWSLYYYGVMETRSEKQAAAFDNAESLLLDLVNSGRAGDTVFQCHLALAMTYREQGRFDEAERAFARAAATASRALKVQVRYELARLHLAARKFDEARTVLEPLAKLDAERLKRDEQALRFYISLAKLWHANSYLVEAEDLQRTARNSAARRALLIRAQRIREKGLKAMGDLRELGGAWPALVQLFIEAGVDPNADPQTMGATELLTAAELLLNAAKPVEARARLEEALRRENVEPGLRGNIVYTLGKAQYQLRDVKAAARSFEYLASELRAHPRAAQAATFAYQLLAEIADRGKRQEDYERLARCLLNLLQNYPDHPKQEDAMWWLPVALQQAGHYDDAAQQYANVPPSSRYRDEAQYRAVLCRRLSAQSHRAADDPSMYKRQSRRAADALLNFALQTEQRIGAGSTSGRAARWAAEARINAAEIFVQLEIGAHERALSALRDFETRFPNNPLLGRVLGLRIRAYRGLRDFDAASKALSAYLEQVPPDRTGAVLLELARGMEDEVRRLQDGGRTSDATQLARDSLETFTQLEQFLQADPRRAADVPIVQFSRAQMLHAAGEYAAAEALVDALLAKAPRNGNYQRLRARIRQTALPAEPTRDQLAGAVAAWEALLRDPAIRDRAPETYWEARYHWLHAKYRLSDYETVEKAIRNERVWYPELGGKPWKSKIETLYEQVRTKVAPETEK